MEHERDGDTNCKGFNLYCHQRIDTEPGEVGKKTTSGDNPNYGIITIGQNTERNPGDLRRLAVTQTPVRNHQQMPVRKTLKNIE